MENWNDNIGVSNNIVLNSRVQLVRNFNDLPFPYKINKDIAQKRNEEVFNQLKSCAEEEKFEFYTINKNNYYNELLQKNIIEGNVDKSGFVVNKSKDIGVIFNNEEHITISVIENGMDLEKILNKANKIDDTIEDKFEYAFDERVGYLTTDINDVGSGFIADVVIHLPALTASNQIKQVSDCLKKTNFSIQCLYFENKNEFGEFYTISSNIASGLKEIDTINNLKKAISDVISEEERARTFLISQQPNNIHDKVLRANAILGVAVLVEFREAVELLSYVRFGIELGILNIDIKKVDKALNMVSTGYINNYIKEQNSSNTIAFERAKIIKNILFS